MWQGKGFEGELQAAGSLAGSGRGRAVCGFVFLPKNQAPQVSSSPVLPEDPWMRPHPVGSHSACSFLGARVKMPVPFGQKPGTVPRSRPCGQGAPWPAAKHLDGSLLPNANGRVHQPGADPRAVPSVESPAWGQRWQCSCPLGAAGLN